MNHYYTYWEAYDINGVTIQNGNGNFGVEGQTTPANVNTHSQYLLNEVRKTSPEVTRVVLKTITKL